MLLLKPTEMVFTERQVDTRAQHEQYDRETRRASSKWVFRFAVSVTTSPVEKDDDLIAREEEGIERHRCNWWQHRDSENHLWISLVAIERTIGQGCGITRSTESLLVQYSCQSF